MKQAPKFLLLLLSIAIVLTILLSNNFYNYRTDLSNRTAERDQSINTQIDDEWDYTVGVLTENSSKATMQSKILASNIERETRIAYPDLSVLKTELDNKTPNTTFSEIVRRNFDGVYMNDIKNSDNDPWAAMSWGISGDFSTNCTKFGVNRTWDSEQKMHANKVLAKIAIDAVLTMSDKLIFWEYLKSDDPNHMMISSMTLDALHQVYLKEGVSGLKTYEFLSPWYITSQADIFGVPDIDNNGIKNINNKVIITQGFNLYEELMKEHAVKIASYDMIKNDINRRYDSDIREMNIKFISSNGMMFLAIIAILFIYNKICDYMQLSKGDI